jgi:peptidylprolyl isomerase
MTVVKEGYKVCILFEAKLKTGETVLKTDLENPMELTIGKGKIPATLEKALIDMKEGESKTITLDASESFGPKLNNLIIDLPKEGFGSDTNLQVGSRISMNSPDGKTYIGTIMEIKDENITVDFNHPLAGKSLIFTVTVITIQ